MMKMKMKMIMTMNTIMILNSNMVRVCFTTGLLGRMCDRYCLAFFSRAHVLLELNLTRCCSDSSGGTIRLPSPSNLDLA